MQWTNLLLIVITLVLWVGNACVDAAPAGNAAKQETYLKRTGMKFLEETAKKSGVIRLKSGMLVEILKESDKADAKSPNEGDSCEVTYLGTFKDGNKFDGSTTSFAPNQVIKGWTEAMQLMAEGSGVTFLSTTYSLS